MKYTKLLLSHVDFSQTTMENLFGIITPNIFKLSKKIAKYEKYKNVISQTK